MTLFEKKLLVDVISEGSKMNHPRFRRAPNLNTGVFIRERRRRFDTRRDAGEGGERAWSDATIRQSRQEFPGAIRTQKMGMGLILPQSPQKEPTLSTSTP